MIATSLRTPKLSLWPNPAESKLNNELEIERLLYSKFTRFGYNVKISCPEGDDSFTVEFEHVMMAQKALNEASKIGNTLKAKKLERPTPCSPRFFKVLSKTLTVRAGRTLNSSILHEKQKTKGERVIINRTKGRRARLVEKQEDGTWGNVGWVSLFSSKGYPLMMQLEKCDLSIKNTMDLEAAKKQEIPDGNNNRCSK